MNNPRLSGSARVRTPVNKIFVDEQQPKQQQHQDITWIPPPDGENDVGEQLEESSWVSFGEKASAEASIEDRHEILKESMDLVLDASGFLVPRPYLPYDDSFDFGTEDSISVPYSKLMEKPDAPFGKSARTLTTEALTATTIEESASSFFLSPRTPATPLQSPSTFYIPGITDKAMSCFISPLPDPSPGFGLTRKSLIFNGQRAEDIEEESDDDDDDDDDQEDQQGEDCQGCGEEDEPPTVARHLSVETQSSGSTGAEPCRSAFFIPGITAKGRTLNSSVEAKQFQPRTPVRRKHRVESTREASSAFSEKIEFSPLNRVPTPRRKQLELSERISKAAVDRLSLQSLSLGETPSKGSRKLKSPMKSPGSPRTKKRVSKTRRSAPSLSSIDMERSATPIGRRRNLIAQPGLRRSNSAKFLRNHHQAPPTPPSSMRRSTSGNLENPPPHPITHAALRRSRSDNAHNPTIIIWSPPSAAKAERRLSVSSSSTPTSRTSSLSTHASSLKFAEKLQSMPVSLLATPSSRTASTSSHGSMGQHHRGRKDTPMPSGQVTLMNAGTGRRSANPHLLVKVGELPFDSDESYRSGDTDIISSRSMSRSSSRRSHSSQPRSRRSTMNTNAYL